MKLIISFALIFVAVACTKSRYAEHVEILLEDSPSSYKQGYIDGCGSGENAAGNFMTKFNRSKAYLDDHLYRKAWHVGFDYCKEQLEMDRDFDRLVHGA
jgi:hypothetical protein